MSSSAAAHDHHHADPFPTEYRPDELFGKVSPGKIGMWVFLLSDAMMFAGFLLAYGIARGGADVWIHPGEPELGINFTAGLTFLLICSSVTMVLAYAACVEKNQKKMVQFLALTAIGGMLFLCGQYHEYFGVIGHGLTGEGLTFGNSHYATTFYVITSFHGMHVTTGVIILWTFTYKAWKGKYKDGNYNEIEIVGLFWHFVDLIWILVFTFVYLL